MRLLTHHSKISSRVEGTSTHRRRSHFQTNFFSCTPPSNKYYSWLRTFVRIVACNIFACGVCGRVKLSTLPHPPKTFLWINYAVFVIATQAITVLRYASLLKMCIFGLWRLNAPTKYCNINIFIFVIAIPVSYTRNSYIRYCWFYMSLHHLSSPHLHLFSYLAKAIKGVNGKRKRALLSPKRLCCCRVFECVCLWNQ